MLHQKQQNFIMHVTDEYNQIVVTALVNITSWNVGPALLDNLRGRYTKRRGAQFFDFSWLVLFNA